MVTDFIKRNREFWSKFPTKDAVGKILIEEPSIPIIIHPSGVFAVIINQVKSLNPVWLFSSYWDIELLKSYVPTTDYIKLPKLSRLSILRMRLIAIWKFAVVYMTRNVLALSYDGIRYGDIVYDSYLAQKSMGTIRGIDLSILRILYACIRRHESVRKVLQSDTFEAVLVFHTIGIRSGVMLRTALRYGYKGYSCVGHDKSTLQCLEKLDEVYDYRFTPSPEDVDAIIARLGEQFGAVYEQVYNNQVSGIGNLDAQYAFSNEYKLYHDRNSFNWDYNLDPKKKNVFIMLHAFNDYPHSHFRWMIFKDYYDWFIQTLRFTRTNDTMNWIFKQHPAIRFYPMKDVSLDSLFLNNQKNVVYISERDQIDTRSLIHCADLVVTCLGSAGFELPAMAGIPSVTAGDNFYTGLGFAMEPKTKEEYFEILNNAANIERLTPEQQKRAQAAYMYIYHFSGVDTSVFPHLSLYDQKNRSSGYAWYWEKVINLYDTREEIIIDQLHNCIAKIAKPGFKRLNSL